MGAAPWPAQPPGWSLRQKPLSPLSGRSPGLSHDSVLTAIKATVQEMKPSFTELAVCVLVKSFLILFHKAQAKQTPERELGGGVLLPLPPPAPGARRALGVTQLRMYQPGPTALRDGAAGLGAKTLRCRKQGSANVCKGQTAKTSVLVSHTRPGVCHLLSVSYNPFNM